MGLVTMTEHYYTTDETHRYLLNDTITDPVEQTIKLRNHVEGLPETKSTFVIRDAMDARRASQTIVEGAMKLVGVWRLPERYTGNSTQNRAVNPFAAHAFRYGDVGVYCDCGALITVPQVKRWQDNPQDNANKHEEWCPMDARTMVDGLLWEERREVIIDSLYYGVSGERLCSRLSTRGNSITKYTRRLGIDRDALQSVYLQVRANTMAELRERGYLNEEIGAVYGISRAHVSKEIDRRTETSCAEIHRENDYQTDDRPTIPVFGGNDDD